MSGSHGSIWVIMIAAGEATLNVEVVGSDAWAAIDLRYGDTLLIPYDTNDGSRPHLDLVRRITHRDSLAAPFALICNNPTEDSSYRPHLFLKGREWASNQSRSAGTGIDWHAPDRLGQSPRTAYDYRAHTQSPCKNSALLCYQFNARICRNAGWGRGGLTVAFFRACKGTVDR